MTERALGLCGGNPLLLRHMGAGLRRGEDLPEVQTAFPVARFAGLGELGQRYLHAASVLGTRFRPAAVEEICALSPDEIHRVLSGLCKSGLLRDGSRPGLAFT